MQRSLGLMLISGFFVFGTVMASLATVGLLFPAGPLEPMWRLNRYAQVALLEMRWWGILLMLSVAVACALAAIGIATRRRWGQRLAVVILAVNLLGDVVSVFVRSDWRTLIGVPIAGALILYLLNSRTRAQFETTSAGV